MRQRLPELDSLRGIAALSVVFGHCVQMVVVGPWSQLSYGWVLLSTPLAVPFAANAAVHMFFVLSGFVLTLPLMSGDIDWRGYVLRRVCRIWIPYVVMLGATLAVIELLVKRPLNLPNPSLNSLWTTPLSPSLIVKHVLLVPAFDTTAIMPVVWTLVHEMRVSLAFPLIALATRRLSPGFCLAAAAALSLTAATMSNGVGSTDVSWAATLHYSGLFVLGSVLAQHRTAITGFVSRLSTAQAVLAGVASVVAYTYLMWIVWFPSIEASSGVRTWIQGAGAAGLISLALGRGRFTRALNLRPAVYLGRVSYSLYLSHQVILFALGSRLLPGTPVVVVWLIGCAASLLVAGLGYRYVELPAIRLGRTLAGSKAAGRCLVSGMLALGAVWQWRNGKHYDAALLACLAWALAAAIEAAGAGQRRTPPAEKPEAETAAEPQPAETPEPSLPTRRVA